MPASSRKRNKGKERKAKKEEAERVGLQMVWRAWARGDMLYGGPTTIIQCNHGFGEAVLPDESHPVSSFITTFCMSSVKDAFLRHQEGMNDDNNRQLASDILTSVGTNMLCAGTIETTETNIQYSPLQFIINIALAITTLENYDEELDYQLNSVQPSVLSKYRDIWPGSTSVRRDLLKFFRKRNICSCLKKMHLEARKAQPKIGMCQHCNVKKERKLLMVCSRCMVSQYCSRACQVEASPEHKNYCVKFQFFDSHKDQQQQANNTSNGR